jgi:hypothetical protein
MSEANARRGTPHSHPPDLAIVVVVVVVAAALLKVSN